MDNMKRLNAIKIAFIYALSGCIWILGSDMLLSVVSDQLSTYALFSIGKGLLFVLITSLVLYTLIHRFTADQSLAKRGLLESEERFRSLVEMTEELIWESDAEGSILYCSPASERILGYRPDELVGNNIISFLHGEDQKMASAMLPGNIAEKRGWRDLVLRWRGRDGLYRDLSSRAVPVLNEQGNVIGFRGSELDITSRKKTDDDLVKTQKLESLGIIAGGIAHEINNTLTVIIGNIDLVKMKLPEIDPSVRRLEEAENASLHARDLARQLLTFSKGSSPVKKIISLEPLIKHYSSFALRGRNVSVEFDIAGELWPAEVDEGQIGQVFNNLVINACQAMPNGGKIRIAAENTLVEASEGLPLKYGAYVKLTIEDQGMGIPPENLDKIFDPYYTTKNKASGLGLAVSKTIIRNHGGYITATSAVGSGTTIIIYLPHSRKGLTEQKASGEDAIAGKGRILVMDDEEMVRSVAGAILRQLGYQVEFAGDGAEAVRLYKMALDASEPFDAVIMDLTVPGGMGGREALRELLAIDPQTRAIVSSGYSDDPIMSGYKDYGFTDVIPKPYSSAALSRVLHKVLTGPSEPDEGV